MPFATLPKFDYDKILEIRHAVPIIKLALCGGENSSTVYRWTIYRFMKTETSNLSSDWNCKSESNARGEIVSAAVI